MRKLHRLDFPEIRFLCKMTQNQLFPDNFCFKPNMNQLAIYSIAYAYLLSLYSVFIKIISTQEKCKRFKNVKKSEKSQKMTSTKTESNNIYFSCFAFKDIA